MSGYLKYIKVTVPYYIIIAITAAFVGIATSGGIINNNAILAFLSLAFLVGGFNTFNGITDLKIDLINKPYRPIPSGKIKIKHALLYAVILYALSLLIAYYLTYQFFQIIILSSVITILYSFPRIRLRKRFLIGNFCGAIFYGLLCPLAGWALMPLNPIPIYIIAFTFLFAFSLSITKDFEDFIGDRIYSIKTVPVTMGVKEAAGLTSIILLSSFGYFYFAIILELIAKEFIVLLITLPIFLFLIKEMYKSGNNFNTNKKKARNLFYGLIGLGVLVEFLIGIIALVI